MRAWIVDPGHGGSEIRGASTPFGACCEGGLVEKELALDVAQRVRRCTCGRAQLTREADVNRSLAERTSLSAKHGAESFVSLHLNASEDRTLAGAEIWLHPHATRESARFAERLSRELARAGQAVRGIHRGPLAVLDPAHHPADTAACLVELGYGSHPAESARFRDPSHREALASAISRALEQTSEARAKAEPADRQAKRAASEASGDGSEGSARAGPADRGRVAVHARRESFDVWHEVPLVQQLTGMSCWAAAAAMVVGWRDCIDVDADEVAQASGTWASYRDGLEPRDVDTLARTFGLLAETPKKYRLEELRKLLERFGPLWVGEASPGLHVIVIAGMYGDGTPDGTFMRIADPWPIGRGERYTITFRELAQRLDAVHAIAGIDAQVIHSGGRACGASGRFFSKRESRLTLEGEGLDPERAYDVLLPYVH